MIVSNCINRVLWLELREIAKNIQPPGELSQYWAFFLKWLPSLFAVVDNRFSGLGKAMRVCLCIWTINFELNDLKLRYLACWFNW